MIDAVASRAHYRRHLQPMWDALPADQRGTFYVTNAQMDRTGATFGPPPTDGRNPTLIAATADLSHAGHRPVCLVEHGAGQTYSNGHPAYSGGAGRDAVSLFLCPNEMVAAANRRAYPHARIEVVGCPALDRHRGESAQEITRNPPLIAVAFHWGAEQLRVPEALTALPHHADALPAIVAELRALGCDVVGHAHPRQTRARRIFAQADVEMAPDWDQLLERLDVLVVDNSSIGFEAAAVGVPVVWLNAPWYRTDVEHGLRFWAHVGVGYQVEDPALVSAVVAMAIEHGQPPGAPELVAEVFPHRGEASVLAAAAVGEWALAASR